MISVRRKQAKGAQYHTPADVRGHAKYAPQGLGTRRAAGATAVVTGGLDSQAIVVLMRPTLDSREILANSSANAGVSSNLSLETLEQRGECTSAFT